jgi:hypothetical protein
MARRRHSRLSAVLGPTKRLWSEFDYAQRRLFEIQTGISSRPKS